MPSIDVGLSRLKAWRKFSKRQMLAEVGAVRAVLADRPVAPFVPASLMALTLGSDAFRSAGMNVAAGGTANLRGEIYALSDLSGEIGVRPAKARTRTGRIWVDSWRPIELALAGSGADRGGDEPLVRIWEAARHWLDRHDNDVALPSAGVSLPTSGEDEDFVGHNAALAARFELLAELAHRLASVTSIHEHDYARLLRALLRHGEMLAEDRSFSAHSNHGMLQTLAQIRGAGCLVGLEAASPVLSDLAAAHAESGRKRLAAMIETQFASDGGHLEHSPSYHLALVAALERLAAGGSADGAVSPTDLALMRAAGMTMVDCAGQIAEIGDTDRDFPLPRIFLAPIQAIAPTAFALPQTGYWIVKGRQREHSVYLAQTAAFHSRVHKQADAGAFLWREGGKDILIDAGAYGYVGRTALDDPAFRQGFWYADPRRRYVEMTRAHNAFSLNGLDQPRYRSVPYGSGLIAWAEGDGVFASETSIANLPRAQHFRILVYRPADWLLCLDGYRANAEAPVFGDQYFQFAPTWRVCAREPAAVRLRHTKGAMLHVTNVFNGAVFDDDAFGRGDPEKDDASALWGWHASGHMQFEPCPALRLRATGSHVVMASLMTFDEPSRVAGDFNVTRRRIRVRWAAGDKFRGLTIDRAPDAEPSMRLQLAYAEQSARRESERY
ncbi:heparinase II/III domain-containing protein [Bosea robiniae]|uniref:Heparinase II/III N-terminus n=1 Tax=Bosea robiniae TaxID=1036780 RepID=A0ABY0P1E3_9HYPH|nr:heparinase II/III family protein [Bosea robiniae]SDG73132.1 Heparinase II/III N-terminus [Bosea robiniae]